MTEEHKKQIERGETITGVLVLNYGDSIVGLPGMWTFSGKPKASFDRVSNSARGGRSGRILTTNLR